MTVPMLIAVPLIDYIGFEADPLLYFLHEKYVVPGEGVTADVLGFLWTFFNSLFYLN